jgi:hypothetical protein
MYIFTCGFETQKKSQQGASKLVVCYENKNNNNENFRVLSVARYKILRWVWFPLEKYKSSFFDYLYRYKARLIPWVLLCLCMLTLLKM